MSYEADDLRGQIRELVADYHAAAFAPAPIHPGTNSRCPFPGACSMPKISNR